MEGKVGAVDRHVGGSVLQPGGDPFKFAAHAASREFYAVPDLIRLTKRPKRCRGRGRAPSKKCGIKRRRLPFPFARCWSEFPPRSGRKFTPRFIAQSVNIRMARRSRSECQSCWRGEKVRD